MLQQVDRAIRARWAQQCPAIRLIEPASSYDTRRLAAFSGAAQRRKKKRR
jgi:hypothetical protein